MSPIRRKILFCESSQQKNLIIIIWDLMQSTLVSFLGIFNFIPIQSFSILDKVNSTENVNWHDLQAILMTLLKPESNTTDFAMSGSGSCWHEDFYPAHICVKGAKEIWVWRPIYSRYQRPSGVSFFVISKFVFHDHDHRYDHNESKADTFRTVRS